MLLAVCKNISLLKTVKLEFLTPRIESTIKKLEFRCRQIHRELLQERKML